MSAVAFPRLATARAFVEAQFPAGDRLPAADVERILADIHRVIGRSRMARRVFAAGLWIIDVLGVLFAGRWFRSCAVAKRRALLALWSRVPLLRDVLRVLAMPYRVAYLLDPERQRALAADYRVAVPSSIETARWRVQIQDAAAMERDTTIEADVAVIGTGAGGAVAAYELAAAGLAVVMIEEGRYFDRRDFNGNHLDMTKRLYRMGGVTGTIGNTPIMIPLGRAVGGTTTINSGTCFRTPPEVLARWRSEGLVDLSEESLAPCFAAVEDMLQVQPGTAAAIGPLAERIRTGASALGFHDVHPLMRNAAGCDGQALCQFGCPTDAKRSTNVSYVPKALERGALLVTRFRATRLVRAGERVAGVSAVGSERDVRDRRLTVRARHVVVAMGTMLTPLFLHDNGVRNRWLGRNLSVHPCGGVAGWFPGADMRNTQSIPQGLGIGDWHDRGIRFEGGTPPLVAHGMAVTEHGAPFVRTMERYRETAFFGFMIRDTSRGRVRKGLIDGLPLAIYNMNRADRVRYQEALATLGRIYFRAGAKEVHLIGYARKPAFRSEAEIDAFARGSFRPRDVVVTAYHPLGTARLGASAGHGVCDGDHAVWGHPGLYVMDGAAVPSSLGVNPQVTIMTLATRAARKLAARA